MKNPDDIQINNILAYQRAELESIDFNTTQLDSCIEETEKLLKELGYEDCIKKARDDAKTHNTNWVPSNTLTLPDWDQLCIEANSYLSTPVKSIQDLFSKEELDSNKTYINKLNKDFNSIQNLDKVDITICAVAGIISGAIDILMVGIPERTKNGIKGGPLSNYIREHFEKVLPPEKMEELGREKFVKTPYDAQDNRNTSIDVEGLSSYYHRALTFGHDPILGFIVGVFDIMTGRMTTLDKSGKFVSQVMNCYSDRKETNLFIALAKQILHLKSDITTSAGLPAPLTILFNYCQFGSIGEEDNTIAEIAQGMYNEGCNFIQFCSSSIPVMLTEVIVRLGWTLKRRKEGISIKQSIPFSLDRQKNPKLATMLFIAHTAATAINAGKVAFTKNPMAINYPQLLAFSKYAFYELKWNLCTKPAVRHKFVIDKLDSELNDVLEEIDKDFASYSVEINKNGDTIWI